MRFLQSYCRYNRQGLKRNNFKHRIKQSNDGVAVTRTHDYYSKYMP